MTDEEQFLQERFSHLLSWQKVQRRERTFIHIFFYCLLASLALIPLRGMALYGISLLTVPVLLLPIVAAVVFILRRWGMKESLQVLFLLDKTLNLEERAITAWEILGRTGRRTPELLVLAETAERLKGIDFKRLLKKPLPWQAFALPPLLLLLLSLLWIGVGVVSEKDSKAFQARTLAQQIKEFSHAVKERARSEGLAESLRVASAVEELAEKRLEGQMSEKKLADELSGLATEIEKMDFTAPPSQVSLSSATRESLADLTMELETLKQTLSSPEKWQAGARLDPKLLSKLESFPRLSEELKQRLRPGDRLGEGELSRFLRELEKSAGAELDRRTLKDIAEYLSFILQGMEGAPVEGGEREVAQVPGYRSAQADKQKGPGTLPGDRPGTKTKGSQPLPPLTQGMATHLKGILGEGRSATFGWRGEPRAGKSNVPLEDLIVSYRRQAEEELASEKIPAGLKETIKSYFLSLGMAEKKTE